VTRSQIRTFVEESSIERIREVLNGLQALHRHVSMEHLPETEQRFLLDLRDHEAYFRTLADAKLQGT
jgi:Mg/Co/Ni transporter MgtE